MAVSFEIPIETPSVSNLREFWAKKDKRVSSQRRATAYRMPREVKSIGPMVVVSLTRKSPRQLDDDNLRGALKAVRDQIAVALRVDDASPLVAWEYFQAQAKESSVLVTVRWVSPFDLIPVRAAP